MNALPEVQVELDQPELVGEEEVEELPFMEQVVMEELEVMLPLEPMVQLVQDMVAAVEVVEGPTMLH